MESASNDRGCQGRSPRILILYPQRKAPRSATLLSLALHKLGAHALVKSYYEVSCTYLSSFDLLVLRGLPYYYDSVRLNALITCLKQFKTINNPQNMIIARDKFGSIKVLESAGIPVPKTFLARTKAELLQLVYELGDAVIKPVSGSLGFGVFRVNRETVFYALGSMPFSFEAVVQEYLEKARDVRVLVAGGRALGAMYRVAPFSIASNYAQGAEVDPAPKECYEEIAVSAAEALGLEYAGVDLIETPEGPKVIEVNPAPLWFGLSEACGRDLTLEMASFLLKRACEVRTGADG